MRMLFRDAVFQSNKPSRALHNVCEACNVCASSERSHLKKIILKNVNKAFNEKVQAHFFTSEIDEQNFKILNIADLIPGYGERCITTSRNPPISESSFEELQICRHGFPRSFSGDSKFCQPLFKAFLNGHGIRLNSTPARSSHKN